VAAVVRKKAPRHEVAVCWALDGSERYGDLKSAPVSIGGGVAIIAFRISTLATLEPAGWSSVMTGRGVLQVIQRALNSAF
jgi:hypothetical protein